jgi:hypothetical protein
MSRRGQWLLWGLAAAMVGLTLCAGCGPKKEAEAVGPIFYPPPPDVPRLQFLMSFSDADEFVTRTSSFADIITGKKAESSHAIKNPYGIAVTNGKIYVCDLGRFMVQVIDVVNKKYSVLGTPEQIESPMNITIDSDGTKYVADSRKRMVAVFDAEDRFVRHMGDPTRCAPSDVAISGNTLFVTDALGGRVEVWSRDGTFQRAFAGKGRGPDQLQTPTNLAIGPDGNIYVVDTELEMVKVFSPEGKFLRTIGQPGDRPGFFARPKGIAISPQGHVYVADAQWEVIQIFTTEGQLLLYFGGAHPGPQGMGLPAGVCLDATSIDAFRSYVHQDFEPEYLLFVANEFGNHKIGLYAFGHPKEGRVIAPPAKSASPTASPPGAAQPTTPPPGATPPAKQPAAGPPSTTSQPGKAVPSTESKPGV